MENMRECFKNPPASHRPAPFWVWNDLMTKEQIDFQLKELKTHGFGGAFVHPRPGLITEYLSDEWFDLWSHALKTAKKLGLKLSIYDENSYPSGFACGEVSEKLPDCLACGANYTVVNLKNLPSRDIQSALPSKDTIAAFTCREIDGSIEILKDISSYPIDKWHEHGDMFFVCSFFGPNPTPWLAGFAYVDLMRPEVTEAFLESTHEKYFKRFSEDFGESIPAIFTDEPALYANAFGVCPQTVPYSTYLASEFEKINGYSLLKNLPCVFKNVSGEDFDYPAEKVRFDYYRTAQLLWTKNSIEPIGKWCASHNIAYTGHYMEHEWPHASKCTSPSMQSNYEYHQWPGIDMLLTKHLRNEETHALTLTIRELCSASNQFGKERALCELYGAGGWDSTFEDYKRMGDWVMVNGVNFICQHLIYSSMAGVRKKDHPQSFDWRQPWWDQYTVLNDYVGRTCFMLSKGKMEQRILLLNPTTTSYIVPYDEADGSIFSYGKSDAIKNPDMRNFLETFQLLTDRQWDFDLGDEPTMERHAKAKDGKLDISNQSYDIVIISGDTKNMFSSTMSLLNNFIDGGGKVITIGEPGKFVDGMADEKAYKELSERSENLSLDSLDKRLSELLPERILCSSPIPSGMNHMRRKLDNGREIYFFVNHSFNTFEGKIILSGDSVCEYNLFTGDVTPVNYTEKDGFISFDLGLVRNQSKMFVVGEKADGEAEAKESNKAVQLKLLDISKEEPNIMPIGYLDLDIQGDRYTDIASNVAADTVYAHRGFYKNPWDGEVQYKSSIMDRNKDYGEGSGFTATYHFFVREGFIPPHIDVTAEQWELCRLNVNGTDVGWKSGEHFLDHHFGVADITNLIKDGENTITVVVDKFDVRMELEPTYLRGDFSVISDGEKWILAESEPLKMGSWRVQKMPFYPHAVNYEYAAHLSEKPEVAFLEPGEYDATAVSAIVNGTEILLNADGKRPTDVSALLKKGENRIIIRVCGSMKNLLGPHFNSANTRGNVWPVMWKNAPKNSPKPCEYDLMDWGMKTDPILKTN